MPDAHVDLDDDLYGQRKAPLLVREFICFRLGTEWYGLPVHAVREVVLYTGLTPLPSLPPFILGIFNLRGNIVSITDLRPVLGLPASPITVSKDSRLIVVETDKMETALYVNEVTQVVSFAEDVLEPPLATIAAGAENALEFVSRFKENWAALMNAEKLFEMLIINKGESKR